MAFACDLLIILIWQYGLLVCVEHWIKTSVISLEHQMFFLSVMFHTESFCWHFHLHGTWQGIGNGLPLGAVVTTPEIAHVMAQKVQFNTFGGNPVCSSGGLAVIKVLDKEKRQAHCADLGSHLIARLRELQQKHESNHFQPWHFQLKWNLIFF